MTYLDTTHAATTDLTVRHLTLFVTKSATDLFLCALRRRGCRRGIRWVRILLHGDQGRDRWIALLSQRLHKDLARGRWRWRFLH